MTTVEKLKRLADVPEKTNSPLTREILLNAAKEIEAFQTVVGPTNVEVAECAVEKFHTGI